MPKTVTLRLDDEVYKELREAAVAERRPLSNLIETAALARVRRNSSLMTRDGRDSEQRTLGSALESGIASGAQAERALRCMSTVSSRPTSSPTTLSA